MKRIVLISPSGAFYGSEQVLFDFLSTTTNIYDVYVPRGKFHEILNRQAKHIIHSYDNILWLYINLMMRLAFGHVQGIYINEGGHIRYLKILAKIFRHKSFYAHIRLLEDTEKSRLEGTPDNIKLIAVSDYIADAIKKKTNLPVVTIYDLYQSSSHVYAMRKPKASGTINLGIVGRITDTKGIDAIEKFCDYTEQQAHFQKPVTVNFFGHVDSLSAKTNVFINKANKYKNIKCLFHGYISEKSTIYAQIDILLPVPLSRARLKKRGYNQSELLAKGISNVIHLPVSKGAILRSRDNVSQTHKSSYARWENADGLFVVGETAPDLKGKHVLLIDDVLTTGATLVACADALREIEDIQISVLTLAWAK